MTEKILAVLFVFIKSIIGATGYGGIVLLMAIESACIPLPSELIMPFAGYLVYEGSMRLFWVATAGAIGCNLGSLVAYEIGRYGGRPLVERYGRWILMGRRELDWAERFFERWGQAAVFIGRLLPVFRAGVLRHEAGRELAEPGQILPPVRCGDRVAAVGRDRVVCVVALAKSFAGRGIAMPQRLSS
jgi:membrane protein YqaA with SNARE-associated domain